MQMTYEAFLDAICHRSGFESRADGEQMARTVLRVMGEVLPGPDRRALADELAGPLRSALTEREPDRELGLQEVYGQIAREEQVHQGRAREMAQIVGRALRRAVDGEVISQIRSRLPDFDEIFVNPHGDAEAPGRRLDPDAVANDRTLARGRPGSKEPLAEGRPPQGQPDSVATDENPYGDTKIATGHESTDEDDETLAGGKPGSERPLSDTHEDS